MAKKGRQGIFLFLEVTIALLVLFSAILLAFTYFNAVQLPDPPDHFVRSYLQDAATAMNNRGDFTSPLDSAANPDTGGISEVLGATPSSVCMQVEAYGVTVPDGLVAYWKLDEDEGASTASDSSGNGHTGTIYGNATPGQLSPSGSAYSFDGNGDYLEAEVPELSGAVAFTEAAWVNYGSLPNAYSAIFTRDGGWDGAIFLVQSGAKAGVQTGSSWTPSSTALSPDTWYHVAGTYNGSTVIIYVNGQPAGSYAYSAALGSNDAVRIGALTSSTYGFDGLIDDVRIYDRALSADEIERIYSNPTNLLYAVAKPDCTYSGGDVQVLQVPFTVNDDQLENVYHYAVVKAWRRGARTGYFN